jgi:hypothetical protein
VDALIHVDWKGIPMKPHLLAIILLMGSLLSLLPTALPTPTRAQSAEHCFSETGYCISGRIREFWEQNGGLPVFGFPITPQQTETIEGQPLQVQWFERNRLELHPDNAPPYDVLLGRLGAEHVAQTGAPERDTPREGCRYFEETGFNVCGEVLSAWRAEGLEFDGQPGSSEAENLALFGLPLTGEFETTLADGNTYTVQWFERARFERHPENQPPYNVLLGLLGAEAGPVAQEPPAAPAAAPAGLLYSSGGQQYRVNLDTGTSEVIGAAPPAGSIVGPGNTLIWIEVTGSEPRPSPYSFERDTFQILQSNLDGSNRQTLLTSTMFYQQRDEYMGVRQNSLLISADQSRLFFNAEFNPGTTGSDFISFAFDFTSGQVAKVSPYSEGAVNRAYEWISPDGMRSVVSLFGREIALWPGYQVIANQRAGDVVWLSDGRFVYSTAHADSSPALEPDDYVVLVSRDGTTIQTLSTTLGGGPIYALEPSPDQQQMVFLVVRFNQARELWLVNLDGSGLRQVMTLPGDAGDLVWR